MLRKMRQTEFFENFEYSNNSLIINTLYLNPLFLISSTTLEPLIFKFMFKHSSKATNYILLNILPGLNSLLF